MFTTLRAGTTLCILCATSIISIVVTTCGFVTEKQIAVELPRRKLAGTRHLAAVREICAVIFARQTGAAVPRRRAADAPKALVNAEADAADSLRTVEREQILENSIRQFRSRQVAAANVIAADVDDDVEDTGTVINRVQSLQAKLEIRESHDVPMSAHDSGSRIDEENVERIFGPFLTTKSNGVSMNRLVCHLVIEARDGRLSPLSGVESGSVFPVARPVGNFGSAQ
jgi:light-regulated signal transduction histidine kinase (bacteriophytochrome)